MNPSKQTAFAQIFSGPNKPLQATQHPIPDTLKRGEVLVEIQQATICGSDLHTMAGHRIEPTPAILGHEAVGQVVQVGADRPDLQSGDRVTWTIADSCGRCLFCLDYQLPQKCERLFKYGHATLNDGSGLNGCYASHILLRPGTHIVKVPAALPDYMVAPANCALATMVSAISPLPASCRTVVIQGGGLLGLYACALLRERGVETVFCLEVQPRRLAQIPLFGGIALDGRPEHYLHSREKIMATAEHGVDAVLEVAGVADLVPEGIRLLRPGGYYGFIGMVHPQTALTLTGEQIIRKHLTLYGIHNYSPQHLEEAIQFLTKTKDKYPYHGLVSPPFPLTELVKAVEMAQSGTWHRVSVGKGAF